MGAEVTEKTERMNIRESKPIGDSEYLVTTKMMISYKEKHINTTTSQTASHTTNNSGVFV